jgi:hypothetical protein
MQTMRWPFAFKRLAVLAAACLLAVSGCGSANAPGATEAPREEHIGHVIPAHKPKSFPDAVRRLRELNDALSGDRDSGTKSLGGLQIALDIANWLPEIAADSDMPETPWNEVNTRSARLVADYQSLLSGPAANAQAELAHAGAEIKNLETLLLACQPRWFSATGKIVATP